MGEKQELLQVFGAWAPPSGWFDKRQVDCRNMSSEIMFRHVSVGGQVGGSSDSESQFLVFRL